MVGNKEILKVYRDSSKIEYSRKWFDLLIHHDVGVPLRFINEIFFVENDSKVLRMKSGFVMGFLSKLPYGNGFYFIPGFTKYVINEKGIVFSTITGKRVKRSLDNSGYYMVSVYDDDKQVYRRVFLHLLLARTFVFNDDIVNKHYVNHKDGVKTNINIGNLEWVTGKENIDHSFECGLRGDNVPCLVKDLKTGLVKEYRSLSRAFSDIGSNILPVKIRVGNEPPVTVKNRFEIKLKEDPSDWYFKDYNDPRLYNKTNYNYQGPYEALIIETDEVIVADTILELSEKIDMSTKTIRTLLKTREPTSFRGIYVRTKSLDDFPKSFRTKKELYKLRVVLVDKLGKEHVAKSLAEATRITNLDKSTIKNLANNGKSHSGWSVKEITNYF